MKGISSLGESLQKLIREYDLEKTVRQSSVFEKWDEVVGARLQEVSTPVKMQHGKLMVEVKSAAWRNEIQYLLPQIKQELNEKIGSETVKKIVLI